jgi:hypothetical protein
VVEDRERLRLADQHGVGGDDVRGQLSPGVKSWSADTVLAEHGQIEQVRCGARVGDLPVGQRDPLGEHRHAVDVDKLRATTHAHADDSTGSRQLSELKIAAGRKNAESLWWRAVLAAVTARVCHRTGAWNLQIDTRTARSFGEDVLCRGGEAAIPSV